jgi:hypothetical protein
MRRILLGVTAVLVAGLIGLPRLEVQAADDPHHEHYLKCAKACGDCMAACDSCARHCAGLVADGKKEHVPTMQSCLDCADVCAMAGKISAREGPMAVGACKGCAEACESCATACEKFPQDDHMKACAKSCRDCAAACKEMVMHLSR